MKVLKKRNYLLVILAILAGMLSFKVVDYIKNYENPTEDSGEVVETVVGSELTEREVVKVVIPEGFTTHQTLKRLSDSVDASYEELLAVVESLNKNDSKLINEEVEGIHRADGVLFPATYEFYKDESAEAVVLRLLKEMEKRVQVLGDDENFSAYELLIIASMIEKEARHNDDRAKISGVIRNRLDIDMLLQIDATVLAAVGHKDKVLYKDLEVDSPYNTYKNKGLPPSPIAMPGDASLYAAANPEVHEYLYYVADKDTGYHHFSKTYEEHKENIKNFLK